jgi:hypothetical protein
MTFKELDFKRHPNGIDGCVFARKTLDNNTVVSIIGGSGFYGDGVDLFEIAAWKEGSKDYIKLSEHEDVAGWKTKEEIIEIIEMLSKLS